MDKAFSPYNDHVASATELKTAFGANSDLEETVQKMLGFFESLALTVCAGATDEDMAFELLAGRLIGYATCFKEYINTKRKEQNDDTYYIYLDELSKRWAARQKREKGARPLYLP